MTSILTTENLIKNFGGVLATNRVSIEITGKMVRSIIGPNGAGKTTLVNLITGRLPVSSGKILYKGRDITKKPIHQRVRLGISRTFQINSIFLGLTVFENVRIAKQACRGGSHKIMSSRGSLKEVNKLTWAILERLDMTDMADVPAGTLAHGDQRVLEVGIAIACEPKVLFLDEPTAGMSPAETTRIAGLIRTLAEDIAVVLIEHDMDMVMDVSDRITVLHYGSVIAEGLPDEIKENDEVKEAYLGTSWMPELDLD